MKLLTKAEVVASLKRRRKRLKMKTAEFSESYGVSKQYMNSILSGLMYPNEHVGFEKVILFKRCKIPKNGNGKKP